MEEQDFFILNSIARLPEPAKQNVRAILSAHPDLFPRFSATVDTYIDEYVQIMSGGIEIGNNKLHGAELSKKNAIESIAAAFTNTSVHPEMRLSPEDATKVATHFFDTFYVQLSAPNTNERD